MFYRKQSINPITVILQLIMKGYISLMPLLANNLIIYFKLMTLCIVRSLYHMTYYLLFDSNCSFMFIAFILNQISFALCNVTHPDRGWAHVRKPSLRNNIWHIYTRLYLSIRSCHPYCFMFVRSWQGRPCFDFNQLILVLFNSRK